MCVHVCLFPGCQECEGNCSLIQGVPNNIGNGSVKDTPSVPTGKLSLLIWLTGLDLHDLCSSAFTVFYILCICNRGIYLYIVLNFFKV